jgi:transcriptional regulator with XRE-family HTH domain
MSYVLNFLFERDIMNKTLLLEVGLRIKKLRQSYGLTQDDMAFKMEMSVNMISNYENGKCDISISKLKQIADVLDTSVGYLLGESMNSQEDIDEDILIDEVHRMNRKERLLFHSIITDLKISNM